MVASALWSLQPQFEFCGFIRLQEVWGWCIRTSGVNGRSVARGVWAARRGRNVAGLKWEEVHFTVWKRNLEKDAKSLNVSTLCMPDFKHISIGEIIFLAEWIHSLSLSFSLSLSYLPASLNEHTSLSLFSLGNQERLKRPSERASIPFCLLHL